MVIPPITKHLKTNKESKHEHHADADIYQIVLILLRWWFGMKHNAAVAPCKCILASYPIADGTFWKACRILILIIRLVILTNTAAGSRRNCSPTPPRLQKPTLPSTPQ